MIKRHYYVYGKKMHDDGAGSYSWQQLTFTHTAWFPDGSYVYQAAFDLLTEKMNKVKGDMPIEIICLSRL